MPTAEPYWKRVEYRDYSMVIGVPPKEVKFDFSYFLSRKGEIGLDLHEFEDNIDCIVVQPGLSIDTFQRKHAITLLAAIANDRSPESVQDVNKFGKRNKDLITLALDDIISRRSQTQ